MYKVIGSSHALKPFGAKKTYSKLVGCAIR